MRIFLLVLVMLFTKGIAASAGSINGKIVTETGDELPGAGITVKGTSVGTVTDEHGNFQLDLPEDMHTLLVQAIGFETQEIYFTGSPMVIQMKTSDRALNEMVVTALGVRRNKNELPYSAQKLKGEDITAARESNFINALEGRVAGLDIKRNNNLGGSTNVILRGSRSLTGNNQALFVIDGIPADNSNTNSPEQATGHSGYDFGNAAADINPDNIESITVLKGAAATALYGSRAANGVILISTKKGKPGSFSITVNTGVTTGSIDKSTWIKYQKQYGGGYGKYYESSDKYFLYRDVLGNGTKELVVPTSEDASFGAAFDPGLEVYDWKSLDPLSPSYHKKTGWTAASNDPIEIFATPVSTSNSILISAADEKGSFSAGYTRFTDKGIIENSKIVKDLINLNASYDLASRLTVSSSVNISNINGQGRYGTGYNGYNAGVASNLRQWWQTNVDVTELRAAYFRERDARRNPTWNYADPTDLSAIYWNNPYWSFYENYEQDHRLRLFGNIALNYRINDWVDILGRIGMDNYNEQQEERNAIGSVGTPVYTRFNRSFNELNYDLLANFHKKLAGGFVLSGLLGTNIRRTRIQSIDASTNGGLVIPGLYALSNSVSPINAPLEQDEQSGVDGIFAGATLNYQGLLILDLTARRDQSSTLPKSNNSYYYPSASLGFVFSKLIPANETLSFGKTRLNYAEVGNSAPAYRTTDVYYQSTPFNGNAIYQAGDTKYNPDLKPERTKSFEAGLELAFAKNRAGLDITWYHSNSIDQILPSAVSAGTGYNFIYINAGNVENKGLEITSFLIPVKTSKFTWTVNINYARNRNRVTELPGIDNLQLAAFYKNGVTLNAALNQPYGTLRGTDYVYNDQGRKVVGPDGHYLISSTANNILGNINPDWTGGISNTISYKGLSFSFLIDVRKGGSLFSLDRYYGLATGLPEETAGNNDLGNPMRNSIDDGGGIIVEGVKEDGTENDVRIPVVYGTFGYAYNPDKAFVYDASFVKLREVTLTYALPFKWMHGLRYVKGIDVSLIGRNLWIIHKNMPDADPEDGLGSGNIQGYQTGSYPTVRTYGFNLKFNF